MVLQCRIDEVRSDIRREVVVPKCIVKGKAGWIVKAGEWCGAIVVRITGSKFDRGGFDVSSGSGFAIHPESERSERVIQDSRCRVGGGMTTQERSCDGCDRQTRQGRQEWSVEKAMTRGRYMMLRSRLTIIIIDMGSILGYRYPGYWTTF